MPEKKKYIPEVSDLLTRASNAVKLAKKMSFSFKGTEERWADYVNLAISAAIGDAMKDAYRKGVDSVEKPL